MWAIEIGHMALKRQTWVQNRHRGEDASDEQEKIEEACERIIRMTQNMIECIESRIPHFAEVTPGEDRDDPEQYTIKVAPLEARTMLEKLAAPFAKHLLFVSATTGTAEMFKSAHGYTRPLVKIEAPSGFPVANRMVYSMRAGNMSMRTQAQDAPKVMQALIEVAKSSQPQNTRFDHVNHKGIVHTYNNKITDMVMDAFQAAGMAWRVQILRGSGKKREEILQTFRKSSQPLILVSPSAMLGLSLNDDLGRWQAIVKVPYAYLGDPSVVHRKDQIDGWYEWQTAKDLIQTFGRIVRSETDWGQTYVLDDAFSRFYAQNWHLFPRYIQEAIWQKPD
jgi:Rad3-related DNA helicase